MNTELLHKVGEEMGRQVAKWGHPDHLSYFLPDVFDVCGAQGIDLSTEFAKALCDERLGAAECSWQDILNEEVMEARDEAITGNTEALKVELVQIAAVALSWIESIERSGK